MLPRLCYTHTDTSARICSVKPNRWPARSIRIELGIAAFFVAPLLFLLFKGSLSGESCFAWEQCGAFGGQDAILRADRWLYRRLSGRDSANNRSDILSYSRGNLMEFYLIRHTQVNIEPGTCYGQTDVPQQLSFPGNVNASGASCRTLRLAGIFQSFTPLRIG